MKKTVVLTDKEKIERFEKQREAQNKRVEVYQQKLKDENRKEFNKMMTENALKYYYQNKETVCEKNRKRIMFKREVQRLNNICLV